MTLQEVPNKSANVHSAAGLSSSQQPWFSGRTWPSLPAKKQDVPAAPSDKRRRDNARHLSIGAPATASFIGLMLLDPNKVLAAAIDGQPSNAQGEQEGASQSAVPQTQAAETPYQLPESSPLQPAAAASPATGSSLTLAAAEPGLAELPAPHDFAVKSQAASAAQQSVQAVQAEAPAVGSADTVVYASSDTDSSGESAGTGAYPEEDLGTIGTRQEGSDGDDVLTGSEDNDTLLGGAGDDQIDGLGGDDFLDGGAGDDIVDGGAGSDRVLGGSGDDLVSGGDGDDIVEGGSGDDFADGGAGSDEVLGGTGNDRVDGGTGSDILRGEAGDDVLVIDDYADFAFEDNDGADFGGIDRLEVTDGYSTSLAARLPGLAPDGHATFALGSEIGRSLPEGAEEFIQQVDPQIEHISLKGSADHDVLGSDGDNEIFGNEGENWLWGDGGDDKLAGGDGGDRLFGGDGDDILAGEDGEDFLFGDAGDDTFLFGLNDSAVDTVFDHEGSNRIRIEGGEASQLEARLDGSDLLLSIDGKDVARIDSYEGHEDAFTTVETGDGESQSIQGLLNGQDSGDILADFLDSGGSMGESQATQAALSQDYAGSLAADLLQPFMNGTDPVTGEFAGDPSVSDTQPKETAA